MGRGGGGKGYGILWKGTGKQTGLPRSKTRLTWKLSTCNVCHSIDSTAMLGSGARVVPKVLSRELGDSGQLGLTAHQVEMANSRSRDTHVNQLLNTCMSKAAERADPHFGFQLVGRNVFALAFSIAFSRSVAVPLLTLACASLTVLPARAHRESQQSRTLLASPARRIKPRHLVLCE